MKALVTPRYQVMAEGAGPPTPALSRLSYGGYNNFVSSGLLRLVSLQEWGKGHAGMRGRQVEEGILAGCGQETVVCTDRGHR